MILKSFGCSFIFGSDLADVDDYQGEPQAPPSKSSWPSLLAQHYGYSYKSYARPGSGNLRILEKILTQATQSDSNDFFVIGWSWIDRFDYTVTPIPTYGHVYDHVDNNFWCTMTPVDNDNKSKVYYRDLHSEFRDKLTTLINIKTAIDTLKQKNIPFIMTCMDKLVFDTQWHTTPAISDLQKYVHPYITWFEDQTFLEYSKEKGFPISETLHPLEAAHQAAFDLIKSYNLV